MPSPTECLLGELSSVLKRLSKATTPPTTKEVSRVFQCRSKNPVTALMKLLCKLEG